MYIATLRLEVIEIEFLLLTPRRHRYTATMEVLRPANVDFKSQMLRLSLTNLEITSHNIYLRLLEEYGGVADDVSSHAEVYPPLFHI